MRDYIGGELRIDGRQIVYQLISAWDYLQAKGMTEKEVEQFQNDHYPAYALITQIMGLKHACFLLWRTTHSCQSLTDNLYKLKMRLIRELRDEHNYEFDDKFVEDFGK